MRLFFGVYPPESVQHEAAEIRDRVRDAIHDDRARWTKTAQLHVTLQFLGDHDTDVEAIAAAREVSHAPFRVALSGIGDFGHVYFLGVADSSPLVALADDLGAALRRHGFALDERPYHPHLTIARVRRARPVDLPARTGYFEVSSFALIESRAGEYHTRETFPLTPETRAPG